MAGNLTAAEQNELQEWIAASEEHKARFKEITDRKFIADTRTWKTSLRYAASPAKTKAGLQEKINICRTLSVK